MSQFDEYGWVKRLLYCAGALVLAIVLRGIVFALWKGPS